MSFDPRESAAFPDLGELFREEATDFNSIWLDERRIAVLSLIPLASEATGVNADTLRGMWWVESRSGHPDRLVSPTGAKGDWQFTKETLANVLLHYGPDIAQDLEQAGFMAEADNVRMYTRGFRNLAIEKFGIDANGLALDESESNYLFRTRVLSWEGDIVPASASFLRDPQSFEKYDHGQSVAGNNQYQPPDNILERFDMTRMDLPATTTFAAAYNIREIAEDAGLDAGDYKNAGALYAGYNIGPNDAARLGGELSRMPNVMDEIGFVAYSNPYFFRDGATGTEALANYQEAVDGWKSFGLYSLQPDPNLVQGIAQGLREELPNGTDTNPYHIYSNVMETRGLQARAQSMELVRTSLLNETETNALFYGTEPADLQSLITDDVLRLNIGDIPKIDPNDYRASQFEKDLLMGIHLDELGTDPAFPPKPQ